MKAFTLRSSFMEKRAISRDILRIQGMQSGQINMILLLDHGLLFTKECGSDAGRAPMPS
jgi:hypothetical protein